MLLFISMPGPGELLIIGIFGFSIGSLITAIFLKMAAKNIVKIDVPFGRAFLASFLVLIIWAFIDFAVGFLEFKTFEKEFLSLFINFFVASGIIGFMIKDTKSSKSIGFVKGMSVTLVFYLIIIIIGLVVFGIYSLEK